MVLNGVTSNKFSREFIREVALPLFEVGAVNALVSPS